MGDSVLFQCQQCSKVCQSLGKYNQHLKTHTKPVRCKQCDRGFALRADLTRHVKTRHRVAQQMFPCAYCHFKAKRKDNVSQHIQNIHSHVIGPRFNGDKPNSPRASSAKKSKDQTSETDASLDGSKQTIDPISIFSAASAGNAILLDRLHQSGADMFAIADDGSNALHAAARAGSEAAVQFLLEIGVSPDAQRSYRTPLHEAATSGDWATMRILLRDDICLYPMPDHGSNSCVLHCLVDSGSEDATRSLIQHCRERTVHQPERLIPFMLYVAIDMKKMPIIRLLLSYQGIEINTRVTSTSESFKSTPIHLAAWHGDKESLGLLLACPDIDINVTNNHGTPLDIAIKSGHENVVSLLLTHEDLHFRGGRPWPETEVRKAVRRGYFDIARALIQDHRMKKGFEEKTFDSKHLDLLLAVINGDEHAVKMIICGKRLDSSQWSMNIHLAPLNWAVAMGHRRIVKLLLDHPDTNVNLGAYDNFLPLDVAARNGDQAILRMLLDHPQLDASEGKALYEAVKRSDVQMCEMLLLRPGIDPNNAGPLREAVKQGSQQIVGMLLEHPHINSNYSAPLTQAVKQGSQQIVGMLLEHPDIDPNHGRLLIEQVEHGNQHIVRMLLEHPKTNVNQRHWGESETALHIAVSHGRLDLVELILACVAHPRVNVNAVEFLSSLEWNYGTALDIARDKQHREIIDLLLAHGAESLEQLQVRYPRLKYEFEVSEKQREDFDNSIQTRDEAKRLGGSGHGTSPSVLSSMNEMPMDADISGDEDLDMDDWGRYEQFDAGARAS